MWLISRHIYSVPMLEKMILKAELQSNEQSGEPGTGSMLAAMNATTSRGPSVEVGDEGVCVTDVRPTGRGEFAGRIIEVQCSAGYIERGTRVRVARVTPFAVEVEATET